jgi:hypothetical protein
MVICQTRKHRGKTLLTLWQHQPNFRVKINPLNSHRKLIYIQRFARQAAKRVLDLVDFLSEKHSNCRSGALRSAADDEYLTGNSHCGNMSA